MARNPSRRAVMRWLMLPRPAKSSGCVATNGAAWSGTGAGARHQRTSTMARAPTQKAPAARPGQTDAAGEERLHIGAGAGAG
jgi:hypothetical protein